MENLQAVLDAAHRSTDKRFLLGITGAPGSGKTTLARSLVERVNSIRPSIAASYLPMDGFHLSGKQLAERGLLTRKGAADTFDVDGFVALLERAKNRANREVFAPDYDRELHEPIAARLSIAAESRLVIVEGNYLGLIGDGWGHVSETLDELWYLETDVSVRRQRLEARQMRGGKSAIDASAWVAEVDEPNALQIEATRDRATAIVNSEDLGQNG